ncbi:MAG TPA: sigma 54-interacting transcriptional regulator [Puia sp.]|uniref:sigma-54-dependent Fis family transcriptional regulator n=1 Tax=Puia sp. TaxID=2045100 RepID=UPI002BF8450F|nr:sigma 54-interacting transcriptional regulator [Puia sp.]HVU94447.1 sigma 54-interacting transcriptional regulator [Puia sp.]
MPNDTATDPQRELMLSHYTLERLHEAVFWVNSKAQIIKVNEMASRLSGYSKAELTRMTVADLNPSTVVADFPAFWMRLRKEKQICFEAQHRHKEGFLYDVEVTGNYIEFEGQEFSCSIVRDLRKKHREEDLLWNISQRTSGLTGQDYFDELTRHITATLDVRYSMVVTCSNSDITRLRMLSYVDRKEMKETFEYDTKGTPCEIVMKGRDFFCKDKLDETFPREKGIKSWVAVPIYSPSSGLVIGNIAAFDKVAMTDDKNQTAILRIFAARAGAEIDRLNAWRKLELANDELRSRLKEIEILKNQLQAENRYLQDEIKLNNNFDEIISKSKAFHRVLTQIEQVAATDATVLILGESGTGKELIARAVHNISNRSKRPLVKVNCATLPANLIESELFGHEKGAFTGALEKKIGRFELADGGTIFLDEIGELPVDLQAKLLRILQEGEFERLGNPRTFTVNVRVIAATNRNLEVAMEKKEFREDLFYRLNVFPILSPSLRERKEDIPLLVKHFCQKHENKIGKKITHVPARVMDKLMSYDWPGNVRELENLIERAMILSQEGVLECGDWMPGNRTNPAGGASSQRTMEQVEREHIVDVLKQTNWKVSGPGGAAAILGLNSTTLEARIKKLGIVKRKDA